MATRLQFRLFLPVFLAFISILSSAQNVPVGINYQAVARDNYGKELSEREIDVRFSVISGNSQGTIVYQELHSKVRTSKYGVFSIIIGKGEVLQVAASSEIKPLTVKGTRYIDFLVPGLITMGVMMSCMWGISYGIIEKRSKKLLRRLVATPMKKSHFLIALITVRIVMNFIESSAILLFALIAFRMTIQGNLSALILMFLAGNIAFSGIAVLVSSHTSNTEVGNGLINFVVFPMMVLSGIFFSYQNFPEWSLPVIRNLPLTMLTDGIRSIFNEGAGYHEVTLPIIILLTTGALFFSAGLRIFKWH